MREGSGALEALEGLVDLQRVGEVASTLRTHGIPFQTANKAEGH